MKATQHLSRRSLDELEADLVSLAEQIKASEYESQELSRELDRLATPNDRGIKAHSRFIQKPMVAYISAALHK